MSVKIPCPHCKKNQPPYIIPKTEKVHCSLCELEINVNHFVKVQLKSVKQYKEVNQTSFAVKCPKCIKTERPKIINNQIVCGACSKPLTNISDAFKQMLKIYLSKASNDI